MSPIVLIPPAFQAAATEVAAPTSQAFGWWVTVAAVLGLPILFYVLAKTSRLGMIAAATFKEAIRQPLFPLLLAISVVILIVNTFLPFFSLGEDVKMLKDCGLATLLISGLLLAVWTASTSIADEIEGKTAMTLLSKPITRRQFVLGKYMGIMQSVFLLLAVAGAVLLFCVYYKVGYDARESSKEVPDWVVMTPLRDVGQTTGIPVPGAIADRTLPMPEPQRFFETVQVVPGLVLIFLEVAVLGAISVAISTRLPMVVNMTACFAIFVVGHLTPILVQAEGTGRGYEIVRFVGQLIATVLPALEWFSIQGAVATERIVPPDYLGWATLYSGAFAAAAILLAFILFEDRDLA
jgi:ABC-type transport system involved in multi-copper enzyme maturation permease subunit